ncbi:hypothetical protein TIFTF001_036829 [Ficus carica]|uniref:Uncharacterized protein n=1 Tax=Ficus carica TaxID=3494 RepID=A0AA88E5Z7_FICCA|nr:hypothetical protein TIFTF001_036791 [Ficus carica]GMN67738.1 hypothetical protein TIFTF001_036802 [Ficus carica]GMN67758.1 hypothetical protein TIFTF001_036814 [Ficus carica]GMN67762.1 hypothetical protein TIFTF001_036829 [Ficus carica]
MPKISSTTPDVIAWSDRRFPRAWPECPRRGDTFQMRKHPDIGDRTGAVTGGVSDVRRLIVCCDRTSPSARARQCGIDSGKPLRWHSGVMRDDLSGPRALTPATTCPRYTADIDDAINSGRVTKFLGKNLA